jgi:hypothetical protein
VELINEINGLKREKKVLQDEKKLITLNSKNKKDLENLMPQAANLGQEMEENENEKLKIQEEFNE